MPLPQTFKAMVVSETADQKFIREIRQRELSDLPAGELLIEVKYSSLNYKDALSRPATKASPENIRTRRGSMPRELSPPARLRSLGLASR